MGAEDTGLRPITQSQCDQTVYIPMAGNLQKPECECGNRDGSL